MKKAVLFDLFGTLVPSPPIAEYRQMVDDVAGTLNLPGEEFFERWMEVNDHRLNGHFGSSEAEVEHAANLFGVDLSRTQLERCVSIRREAVRSWVTAKPGAIAALDSLANSGVRLALVSDCVFDVPAIWPGTELAHYFDTTVFSCEQQTRKPDRRMYEAALGNLNVTTEESLFVGDGGSSELQGADALGIDAVLLDDRTASSEVLRVDVRDWSGPKITELSELAVMVRG